MSDDDNVSDLMVAAGWVLICLSIAWLLMIWSEI